MQVNLWDAMIELITQLLLDALRGLTEAIAEPYHGLPLAKVLYISFFIIAILASIILVFYHFRAYF